MGPGLEFQYGISDCPVYPRTLYARFTVYDICYLHLVGLCLCYDINNQ